MNTESKDVKFGKSVRVIVQIGSCSGITLPPKWLKHNDIERGDVVEIVWGKALIIKGAVQELSDEEKKLVGAS